MSFRILVAEGLTEQALAILRDEGWRIDLSNALSPAELRAVIPPYHGLIVRTYTCVTAEVIEAAGHLKVIGRPGVGVDNVDLEAATRCGIVVMNTPGANTVSAAELTVGLLVAVARAVPQADAWMKAGKWERQRFAGAELKGKRLGIIGLGRIGSTVARYVRVLGMEVVAYDPFVSAQAAASIGVSLVPLDEVLSTSDFVSLHPTLTPLTRGMISREVLRRVKPGARLINTARGEIVDEEALLEALESGQLSGAALDVHVHEPPRDWRLARHPRVVVTPHLGGATAEAHERVAIEIACHIRDYLKSGIVRDAVNLPQLND